MKTIALGWNTSDQLAGSIRELAEKYPNNAPLKELYEAFSSGSAEPVTIVFNDDNED